MIHLFNLCIEIDIPDSGYTEDIIGRHNKPGTTTNRTQSLPLRIGVQTPSPERQGLQLLCCRLDKHYKCDCADEHAEHVGHVVPVTVDVAGTAAVDAAVLLWLEGAGKWGRDKGAFQGVGCWGDGWGKTCCYCEHVDEFENEDAGERSAQVADTGSNVLAILCTVY
jgi:hypothetical protein